MSKRYGYVCGDHEVNSPERLDKCPGYTHGVACAKPLKQVTGPKK